MQENNKYYYNDKYMYFYFNDKHSSEYNLFMINSDELIMENQAEDKTEFISAQFQQGAYCTGTTKSQKVFKRKCAAGGLTLSQYKQMMLWLKTGTISFLVFDSNPYWGWNVVLTDVSDTSYAVRDSVMVVEFELTFKTVGSYLACNNYQAYYTIGEESSQSKCNGNSNTTMCCNEYHIPVIYIPSRNTTNVICVQGVNNMHQTINWYGVTKSSNARNAEVRLSYANADIVHTKLLTGGGDVLTYYGDAHAALINDQAVDSFVNLVAHNQSDQLIDLNSIPPIELHTANYTHTSGDSYLTLGLEEAVIFESGEYNFICMVKEQDNAAANYGENWNKGTDSKIYTTYLFFLQNKINTVNFDTQYLIKPQLSTPNAYANYYTNSQYAAAPIGASYSEDNTAYITSAIQRATSAVQYYINFPDIEPGDYRYYIGYANTVTLSTINMESSSLEVVSYNNL